ncbi:hypothetical protein PGB90_005845 [Kerria lacca]
MNGEDATFADEYVQEFDLDAYENLAIKSENIATSNCGNNETVDGSENCVNSKDSSGNVNHRPNNNGDNNNINEVNGMQQPSTVIMLHHQLQRLPPMSLPISSPMLHGQSPPHHLLTPPDNHTDHYHHQPLHHHHHRHHHQMMQSGMMVSSVKAGNLIMYPNPNIPGTPPDTPPVSNSPSPQSAYHLEHLHHHHHHHLHQQQYPHIQQVHPKGSGYVDEMLWLSQSVDLRPEQEPIDLRPNCNGGTLTEVQNWNIMQQHTSVITGNGKHIFQADYLNLHHHHRQQQLQNQQLSPLLSTTAPTAAAVTTAASKSLNVNNNGLISPASISSRTNSTSGRSISRAGSTVSVGGSSGSGGSNAGNIISNRNHDHLDHNNNNNSNNNNNNTNSNIIIDDNTLLHLSVRDLNIRLKGSPKDLQNRLKQRRRTLKNRGYARNCRFKRVHQKDELEHTNHTLLEKIAKMEAEIQILTQERNLYRQMIHQERVIESSTIEARTSNGTTGDCL